MRFYVCLLTFIFCTGCGLFQKHRYLHYDSCGPDALYYAMSRLDFDTSRMSISREILNDNIRYTLLRDVLSLFDRQAKHITFPSEIRNHLKKHGIKMTVLSPSKLSELTPDKTAIVLVHQKDSFRYHWGCFPVTPNLTTFFGEGTTSIESVILLER